MCRSEEIYHAIREIADLPLNEFDQHQVRAFEIAVELMEEELRRREEDDE